MTTGMDNEPIKRALIESVNSNMAEYIDFVNSVMNDEKFRKCAHSLLPFDGDVHTDISFPSDGLTLGISLVSMDVDSKTFALGLTLAMDSTPSNKPFSITIFITAGRTFDEMCAYVNNLHFKDEVRDILHTEIEERIINANSIPNSSVE